MSKQSTEETPLLGASSSSSSEIVPSDTTSDLESHTAVNIGELDSESSAVAVKDNTQPRASGRIDLDKSTLIQAIGVLAIGKVIRRCTGGKRFNQAARNVHI